MISFTNSIFQKILTHKKSNDALWDNAMIPLNRAKFSLNKNQDYSIL